MQQLIFRTGISAVTGSITACIAVIIDVAIKFLVSLKFGIVQTRILYYFVSLSYYNFLSLTFLTVGIVFGVFKRCDSL